MDNMIQSTNEPKTNMLGLLGFMGYFNSLFIGVSGLVFRSDYFMIFILLGALLLIASIVVSIMGFKKRNLFKFKGITVAGLALNINLVVCGILLVLIMLFNK